MTEIDKLPIKELRALCHKQRKRLRYGSSIPEDCIATTWRLGKSDHELLKSLAQEPSGDGSTRTDVLRNLVEVVKTMDIPKPELKIHAIRVTMPDALEEALENRGRETNRSKVQILMTVIRKHLGLPYTWDLGYSARPRKGKG